MNRQRGLQLLELILVVAILSVVAAVAIPHLAATDPARLNRAAQEVADALRYARSEAIRTAQPHGVLVDHDGSQTSYQDIAVYRVDTSASPFGIAAVLHHPVDKQPYDRQVVAGPDSRGIAFANAPFSFDAVGSAQQHLHFNADGAPVLLQNGTARRLLSGAVTLRQGQAQRTVRVQAVTGQVSVE